jgi:phenylacetate-CoA ligase
VESALLAIQGISPHYQLVLGKKGFVDTLDVHVELNDPAVLEVYSELEKVEREVAAKLHSTLGLECKIHLREPGAIERTTGKAKRVVDNREARQKV